MESIGKLINPSNRFVLRPILVAHKMVGLLLIGILMGCTEADILPVSAPPATKVTSHDLVGPDNRFDDAIVTAELCINATIHDVTLQDCVLEAPQMFLEADAGRQSTREYSRLVDFAQQNIGTPPASLPVTVQGRYHRTFLEGEAIHTIYIQRVLKLQGH
jgi:hypothetical protein